jgi:hypothetical protein
VLGVAGSAWAAVAVNWLSPVLILLSVSLIGRSFYVLYVQKRGTAVVKVLTWASAVFIVCFWTWWLLSQVWST